jgi:hypothetical protein
MESLIVNVHLNETVSRDTQSLFLHTQAVEVVDDYRCYNLECTLVGRSTESETGQVWPCGKRRKQTIFSGVPQAVTLHVMRKKFDQVTGAQTVDDTDVVLTETLTITTTKGVACFELKSAVFFTGNHFFTVVCESGMFVLVDDAPAKSGEFGIISDAKSRFDFFGFDCVLAAATYVAKSQHPFVVPAGVSVPLHAQLANIGFEPTLLAVVARRHKSTMPISAVDAGAETTTLKHQLLKPVSPHVAVKPSSTSATYANVTGSLHVGQHVAPSPLAKPPNPLVYPAPNDKPSHCSTGIGKGIFPGTQREVVQDVQSKPPNTGSEWTTVRNGRQTAKDRSQPAPVAPTSNIFQYNIESDVEFATAATKQQQLVEGLVCLPAYDTHIRETNTGSVFILFCTVSDRCWRGL